MATQKGSGGPDDLSLLVAIHRGGSRAKAVLIAETHFSKDETLSVLHDEVDLTQSAAKISCDFFEPLRLEMIKREYFCLLTY